MFIQPDHVYLQYCGRIDRSDKDARGFVYPCSSVTFRFRGKGISVLISNRRAYWDSYLGIILDAEQKKIRLKGKGRQWYTIGENLDERVHTLVLFKRQDACHEFDLLGFEITGEAKLLEPLPEPKRKMEFFGDSVTAGEVSEAVEYTGKPDPQHNGEYSNSWYSYAWMTARNLEAQIHDTAQGGIALLDGTGYFAPPSFMGMESCWDKLRYNTQLGPSTKWDFGRYTPDVAVIAIGQNDSHPVDYMKEEPDGERAQKWKDHYREFVEKIRSVYPDALIILATTILCHDKSWDDAIEWVCREINDPKTVHFLYKRNGCGTPGHIRISEAEEMAGELSAFIEGFGEEIWRQDQKQEA